MGAQLARRFPMTAQFLSDLDAGEGDMSVYDEVTDAVSRNIPLAVLVIDWQVSL